MNVEGTYPVTYEEKRVGTVILRRCGLYFEVHCRCSLIVDKMLQLMMLATQTEGNLGLLMPSGGILELRRRVPVKRFQNASPMFFLRPRAGREAMFIEVDPHQPFPQLHRLGECVFCVKDGVRGMMLPQK
jgi:hypothetical protein